MSYNKFRVWLWHKKGLASLLHVMCVWFLVNLKWDGGLVNFETSDTQVRLSPVDAK